MVRSGKRVGKIHEINFKVDPRCILHRRAHGRQTYRPRAEPAFSGAKLASVSFTIMNAGNEQASTPSAVKFLDSTDGTLHNAIALTTAPLHLNLPAGATRMYRVKLSLPASLPAGTYTLLALLDPANALDDPNAASNFIVSANTFVVG